MILRTFLLFYNFIYAFNENLRAVHYSIVNPGIDNEIKPGKEIKFWSTIENIWIGKSNLAWHCDGCTFANDGDGIIVENRFGEPTEFQLSTELSLKENQNVRLTVDFVDYVANLISDSSTARSSVNGFMDYGNNVQSPKTTMICSTDCLNGTFTGNLGKLVDQMMSSSINHKYKIEMIG